MCSGYGIIEILPWETDTDSEKNKGNGYSEEGSHAWKETFSDLISRGLNQINLVISDELKGITETTEEYYHGGKH
ncbi:transposase [Candidatus Peregrinibacteria bacterium]|nr:MAG: transposase [Candidatus Peregrinibacteria bacterium]QQS59834.1 MAG: transposase [Candidatus Peregrinibacteria bacterium]